MRQTAKRRIAFILTLLMLVATVEVQAFLPIHHRDITHTTLGQEGFDGLSANQVTAANESVDLSSEWFGKAPHVDDNSFAAASERLRTKLEKVGDALQECRRQEALQALGTALHTVQDLYAHSNAVDNNIPIPDLLNLPQGTPDCDPANNFAPGRLVSGFFGPRGYFGGDPCLGIPDNVCCHRDLNKDDPAAPNGAQFGAARTAATAATREYLKLVESSIHERFGDRAAGFLSLLKEEQRTIMFAIDTTGSMGDDLDGVKASVNSFLDKTEAGEEMPSLGLVTFKDDVLNRGLDCDDTALRSAINSLTASGGGDCPEASNLALLSALDRFPAPVKDYPPPGGHVLLATDASARDAHMGPWVEARAAEKHASIDAILTGDCVAEDSVAGSMAAFSHTGDPLTSPSARTQLRALTERTGGVLFNVARVEVDDVTPTLLELSDPDNAPLLTRRYLLTASTPLTTVVPVDDTIEDRVTFLVTSPTPAARPAVSLRRPDGTLVQPTDPGVTRRVLSTVVLYSIEAPATGNWQVILQGKGEAVLRAFAGTPLSFTHLTLFDPDGVPPRPEVSQVPLEGLPVAGADLVFSTQLRPVPQEASLHLRRRDGSALGTFPLVPSSVDPGTFETAFAVPSETFLFEVEGLTAAGNPFIRHYPAPVVPQAMALGVAPRVSIASPGTTAPLAIQVTNASATDTTYVLSVITSLDWPVRLQASTLTLEAGATAGLTLDVDVPAGLAEGTRNDFTVFVQNAAQASSRNRVAGAVIAGASNRPPECSPAVPSPAVVWPPNHKLVDIGVLGVTDPDGDPVTIFIDAISQDEPVDGLGNGDASPDGAGLGTGTGRIRAERAGDGNGRVYRLSFSARDGKGGSCQGAVNVGVPHDQGGAAAVDDGQNFDSTQP